MKLLVIGDFQGVFSSNLKKKLKKESFDAVIAVGDYAGIKEWRPYIMSIFKRLKKGKKRISAEEFYGKRGFRNLLKKDEKSAKKVLIELNNLGKPVFLVFGNGDDDWYTYKFDNEAWKANKERRKFLSKLKNIYDLTYGRRKFRKYNLIGFGGYMDIDAFFKEKEFDEENERTLERRIGRRERSRKHLLKMIRKAKGEKIFIFHYPPKGVFDIIRDKKDNPMNGKSAGIGFFREAVKKYEPRAVFCGHMHEYYGMKKIRHSVVINPGDAEKNKYAIVEISEDKNKKIKAEFRK